MSADNLNFQNLTTASTTTDYASKNSIAIINNSDNPILIRNSNDNYTGTFPLNNKQNLELKSDSGFTLPTIRVITQTGTINVSVAWS